MSRRTLSESFKHETDLPLSYTALIRVCFTVALQLETGPELLLMAKKKGMGSSGTYHIFDMRGLSIDSPVDGFDSKTRRYVGKLRYSSFVLYCNGLLF